MAIHSSFIHHSLSHFEPHLSHGGVRDGQRHLLEDKVPVLIGRLDTLREAKHAIAGHLDIEYKRAARLNPVCEVVLVALVRDPLRKQGPGKVQLLSIKSVCVLKFMMIGGRLWPET